MDPIATVLALLPLWVSVPIGALLALAFLRWVFQPRN